MESRVSWFRGVSGFMVSFYRFNRSNFENLFPFVYFDLTKQKLDIQDGVTKLAFHYELSGVTATNYNIYALVLHEQVTEIEQQS